MSLIGNNFSANPQSLRWDDGGGDGGKGTPITNITAIVKIVPKVEFVQTLVYQQSPPEQFQAALIGRVNAGPLFAGGSTGMSTSQWATGAVLLSGLPVVRRWRFRRPELVPMGMQAFHQLLSRRDRRRKH